MRTDRHGDSNRRVSQFCQKAQQQRYTGLKWIVRVEYTHDAKPFDLILPKK